MTLSIEKRRETFRADCSSCFALCCSALGFSRSAEFAFDKPAGEPCANLRQSDFGCGIHSQLRPSGFTGCTVFDCAGAGQKVAQLLFDGVSWRERPGSRTEMFAVFSVVRRVQELCWYLSEALELESGLNEEIASLYDELESVTTGRPGAVLDLDVTAAHEVSAELLRRVGERVRGAARSRHRIPTTAGRFRRGADLVGADLTGADLRAADLRGAVLIAARLGNADLRWCDLIGADLRDADVRGADLSRALFLTQAQLNSTRGDQNTRIPTALLRPDHWAS